MKKKIRCDIESKFEFIPSNYNILVVEDLESVNKVLTLTFQEVGFNCFSSSSLEEAYKYLENHTIHYVMLDINLSNGDSYELMKKLENSSEKIFVLINENDVQFREVSYKKGVIDFLTKDKNFFHKIHQITKTIEQLEANKYKTILVVDDSKVIQKKLQDLLENRNYTVVTAFDDVTALEIIREKCIDLVLLDVELKDSNGIDFLERNNNEIINIKKIPVLIISGHIEASTIRDGLKAGAVDVLKKPYIVEEIVLKVDLWIDYKRKEEEVLCSTQLLAEYKDAVDESSIVSKATPDGIITYVNEQFCKLSGYTQEELLGKSHNIVRHSDMPREAFKEMWHTIKELKQIWRGKVKNRKKDGSYYWVEALIKPILDLNGDIVEFIGLRNDITEVEVYKELLKGKLDNTSKSLEDNVNYTQQYEEALGKFTAVLKTDTNNIITYANQNLCDLSGYSIDELIGKNCKELRHQNHKSMKDCEKLKISLMQNEHISLVFTNITKDGKLFFTDTIAYPITNTKGEVVEYLQLMHDISELTNLHKEIEATQKEIVYKMGEIGESRSKETGNHVKRVAEFSKLLGLLSGMSPKDAETLFTASPMHDIGKVAIPDAILNKPDKLTNEEYDVMKSHAQIGFQVLEGSSREVLKAAAIVAHQHHERWDGGGYPQGLAGEDIHLYGRITAISDVFDALGHDRCYKEAWELEDIFKLFEEEKGKHFDPNLTDLFLANKEQFLEIRERLS